VRFGEDDQFPIVPVRQPDIRSDPQAAVTRSQKRPDSGLRQFAACRRSPFRKSHTVEPQELVLRPNPDVAIRRLRNRVGSTAEISILRSPGGVGVLGDLLIRIRGECVGRKENKQPERQRARSLRRDGIRKHKQR